MAKRKRENRSEFLSALAANAAGEIFDLEGFAAVGADGPLLRPLTVGETVKMPHGSELMYLPDRRPVVFDPAAGKTVTLFEDPYAPGEPIYPVAVFNSPGYVISHTCAFEAMDTAVSLPLFSYGAAGWHGDLFRTAAVRVDREPRQDLRRMPREKVVAGVNRFRRRMPGNRLRAHLEKCALEYGCPAGKNFFLQRYEAPLPTSRACNARCLGCLSLQPPGDIPCSQNRIDFTPSPEEIAEVALAHIRAVDRAVVSFGQGCEGDPLLAADVIEPAIRAIRAATGRGTINMNTNGSLPDRIDRLLDAGLDSIRISLNSFREECYRAYFRPTTYRFADVARSIDQALARGRFVAVNYLNLPGFTDTPEEIDALAGFIRNHPVRMIQWRNLNFDPLRYLATMEETADHGSPVGVRRMLRRIRRTFPDLMFGYFNPPKERFEPAATPGRRNEVD